MLAAVTPEPFAFLLRDFAVLDRQLNPFRNGKVARRTVLREYLNRLSVAALAADRDGRYLVANGAAASLTGFAPEELETMSVWDLTPSPDARTGERLWAAFIAIGEQRGTYSLLGRQNRINDVCYYARAHVLPDVHLSLMCRSSGFHLI